MATRTLIRARARDGSATHGGFNRQARTCACAREEPGGRTGSSGGDSTAPRATAPSPPNRRRTPRGAPRRRPTPPPRRPRLPRHHPPRRRHVPHRLRLRRPRRAARRLATAGRTTAAAHDAEADRPPGDSAAPRPCSRLVLPAPPPPRDDNGGKGNKTHERATPATPAVPGRGRGRTIRPRCRAARLCPRLGGARRQVTRPGARQEAVEAETECPRPRLTLRGIERALGEREVRLV